MCRQGPSTFWSPCPQNLEQLLAPSRRPVKGGGIDGWPAGSEQSFTGSLRRLDSDEKQWQQRRGRQSRSPPPAHRRSQDRSSQSDSGDERQQQRGRWARQWQQRPHCWSPSSSASSSASPGHSQSPRAAAAVLSQRQSLQERLRLREERKQQEELMKAFETPEEKRARRLAKKEAKERKQREKMGWGEEYMGYTNTDNPFGDNNLLGTFIWNKVSPRWPPATALTSACVARQVFLSFCRFLLHELFTTYFQRHCLAFSAHVPRSYLAIENVFLPTRVHTLAPPAFPTLSRAVYSLRHSAHRTSLTSRQPLSVTCPGWDFTSELSPHP